MKKNKYTECYVAFLDILGFKNYLSDNKFENIKDIFDCMNHFVPKPFLKNRTVYSKIKHYVMSDSMIIYIEAEYEDAFIALTEFCLQIQIKLSMFCPPILLRGGIEKGLLYCKGSTIFGPALSDAYNLENSLAKYPRIIFTESIRQEALNNTGKLYVFDYNNLFYEKDDDMLYYLNYLNTFDFLPSLELKNVSEVIEFENEYFMNLFNHIDETLGSEKDASIREKYLWLRKKIVEKVENKPNVKKRFEAIEKKNKEDQEKRFNLALEIKKD